MDKIICVGKNYLKHAQELGDRVPEEPLYFLKPPSTVFEIPDGAPAAAKCQVEWPSEGDLHHELELVLRLGRGKSGAWSFTHYTFGLDMTLRDLQTRLKKAGQPWEKSKVFLNSAILGPWRSMTAMEDLLRLEFSLRVNGELRQQGRALDMRWKPEDLLRDVERWFPLREGDILFTGTPEGVAAVASGDQLEVRGGDVAYGFNCRRGGD
jgi:2-keto-4-pentenoate hydratase/2-oxohepta-3-ene-1,7-dioic acid hydratase in catechol pathway